MGRYPWHLLNVAEYIRDDPTVAPRTLNYVSSQGCVYKCQFCYELTYQRKYSAMEAGGLVDDVADLAAAYDISGVKFYDADFFVNVRRAVEFCDELMARKLGLAWAASINPNDVLRARRQKVDLLGRIAASRLPAAAHGHRVGLGPGAARHRAQGDHPRRRVRRGERHRRARHPWLLHVHRRLPRRDRRRGRGDLRAHRGGFAGLSRGRKRGCTCSARSPARRCSMTHLKYGFEPPDTLEGWADYDYYDSQTPWTSKETVARARANTRLVKQPGLSAVGNQRVKEPRVRGIVLRESLVDGELPMPMSADGGAPLPVPA